MSKPVDLGPLDRTGMLYRSVSSAGLGGAVKNTLVAIGRVYLTQVKVPIRTRLNAERDTEQTDIIWMSRWFDGLANGMVIISEGHTYRITYRQELGRREGWEIYGREDV